MYLVDKIPYRTIKEVADAFGIRSNTLVARMSRHNITIQEAVYYKPKTTKRVNPVFYNGHEYDSISALEKHLGFYRNQLVNKINRTGWPLALCVLMIYDTGKEMFVYQDKLYPSFEKMCLDYKLQASDVLAHSAINHTSLEESISQLRKERCSCNTNLI